MKYLKTYEQQNNIRELDLSNRDLTELSELPDSLEILWCYDNQLIKLPELPDSLERLYCSNNKLTRLPKLPNSLKYLYCQYNKLTKLPPLPDSLELLYCQNNQLTELPELYFHPNLILLTCHGNNLPYRNLEEYKEWYEKTYPERVKAKRFNL